MFHLLISFGGWENGRGSMSNDRIYIDFEDPTEKHLFNDEGNFNIEEIRKIPALLVSETGGEGFQFARVAYINSIHKNGKETKIEYSVDESISPIPNNVVAKLISPPVNNFGFKHTCWSIYEDDLFRILLVNQQNKQFSPTVFSIKDNEIDEDLISVMMPFSAEFNAVYQAIKTAISKTDMICKRADDIWDDDIIMQDVIRLISTARIVICDCTFRNPNVFYEAGIAHTLGKEVILISQSEQDIPFDLRHIRHIRYLNNGEGLDELSKKLKQRIDSILSKR